MLIFFSLCLSLSNILVSGSSPNDKVQQLPADIVKSPSDSEAEIQCSHTDDRFDQILWYKQSDGDLKLLGYMYGGTGTVEKDVKVNIDGGANKEEKCTLKIKDLNLNSSAVYFCAARKNNEAYFGQGTKLTVLEDGAKVTEPQTVKILPPSPHECRDQKKKKGERRKTLVCVASGFYPDHVTVFWQHNGKNITDGVATDAAAKRNETSKLYFITSRLRLQAKTWFNPDNKFSCYVTFFNGTDYNNYSKLIKSNEMDRGMTREKYLTITQNAKLSYSALILKSCLYAALVCFLVWKLQSSPRKQKK